MTARSLADGLASGWAASRCTLFSTPLVVDPAGSASGGRIAWSARGRNLSPGGTESRDTVEVRRGDLALRDEAGVLRIVVDADHDALLLVGVLWPETTCAAVVNKLLAHVAELPFGYPPGVFVRFARSIEDGIHAPRVQVGLSRPLWWFGPVPFPCWEDGRG